MTKIELARVTVSPWRRAVGVAALLLIAGVFGTMFLDQGNAAMMVLSVLALVFAATMLKTTGRTVILTADGLFETDGTEIAKLDQIDKLVTGHFTFRPSNGFSLRLHDNVAPRWRPGLWWSYGHRVGIGGLAASRLTKTMAEALHELLTVRDQT